MSFPKAGAPGRRFLASGRSFGSCRSFRGLAPWTSRKKLHDASAHGRQTVQSSGRLPWFSSTKAPRHLFRSEDGVRLGRRAEVQKSLRTVQHLGLPALG